MAGSPENDTRATHVHLARCEGNHAVARAGDYDLRRQGHVARPDVAAVELQASPVTWRERNEARKAKSMLVLGVAIASIAFWTAGS